MSPSHHHIASINPKSSSADLYRPAASSDVMGAPGVGPRAPGPPGPLTMAPCAPRRPAVSSPQEPVHRFGTQTGLLVVLAGEFQVVVGVEGAVGLPVFVQPDQRSGDVEVDAHGLRGFVRHQRVGFAGRLVDKGAGGRDPVVFEVAPLAREGVTEYL